MLGPSGWGRGARFLFSNTPDFCFFPVSQLKALEDLFKLVGDSDTIIDASGQLRSALSSNVEKMERTVSLGALLPYFSQQGLNSLQWTITDTWRETSFGHWTHLLLRLPRFTGRCTIRSIPSVSERSKNGKRAWRCEIIFLGLHGTWSSDFIERRLPIRMQIVG